MKTLQQYLLKTIEIKRECFNNKSYIFYISIKAKPPPPNPIIISNNKDDKKIFLFSLTSKINTTNIDNAEISNFNINSTFFYPRNPHIYNPIKFIISKIPIPSKSPILSLSKSSLLLMDKNMLQHPPSIINQSSKVEISAKKKKK